MLTESLQVKLNTLRRMILDLQSVLVAFSGGIDSTVVLKIAHEQLGDHALAVTAVSPTFPQVELDVAKRVASEIGVRHELVHTDQLEVAAFVQNDATRCFHCKTDLYQLLDGLREPHASRWIVDGTNLDDLGDDRPGIKAAREWGVRSPLVEASLSKSDVRALAQALGLSNWDKPAAACLSSRIPRGTPITIDSLRRVEQAEDILQAEGFRHVRVREHGDVARIEVGAEEFSRLNQPTLRAHISARLRQAGFRFVCVDLEGYRPGGISLG
ncbi:MAG: ATP-dependent sacrificial sulfur transferase LarE [Nitrospirae bacterium]|jgi:pyridinium-3,5-biscarboxylic acid mononucleotide sulfurtransferase|nr:ATP-dependent sacrificial sulfur transferase LarE [Nitrospirota bacterium]HWR21793.1 ATP-dependent sacrificial sulfur transferase LarE [Verrucomicrobiae bacterium]